MVGVFSLFIISFIVYLVISHYWVCFSHAPISAGHSWPILTASCPTIFSFGCVFLKSWHTTCHFIFGFGSPLRGASQLTMWRNFYGANTTISVNGGICIQHSNSFQVSIGMAPYEVLYKRKCMYALYWSEVSEKSTLGLDIVQEDEEKIHIMCQRLLMVQS